MLSKRTSKPQVGRQVVLLAVTGMSPAVITETVWALAHEPYPVMPDRIVAVTTKSGRVSIVRELLTGSPVMGGSSVWDALLETLKHDGADTGGKLRFGDTGDDIRVITRQGDRNRSTELEDIRTVTDSDATADFLLETLRTFTENPDTQVICSIAGGRKTLAALLYACFSLVGRDTDRITHVLVNEPFMSFNLEPRFYFPTTPPIRYRLKGEPKTISGNQAQIDLADLPFVPLRNLFSRELGRLPGRFSDLVRKYRDQIDELAKPPRVELSADEPVIRVEGVPVRLPPVAFAVVRFLVERSRAGEPAYSAYSAAFEPFCKFLRDNPRLELHEHDLKRDVETTKEMTEFFAQQVSDMRERYQRAKIPDVYLKHLLPHRGSFGIRVAPNLQRKKAD